MSVFSMTGYGKGERSSENYTLTVEIKTLNNRFRDFRFKMGSLFFPLELDLKKELEANFTRGSFDIFINYKKRNAENSPGTPSGNSFENLDGSKIEAFLSKIKTIADRTQVPLSLRPTEFLRNEFLFEDENKSQELFDLLQHTFQEALAQLKDSRLKEGEKLSQKILEHKKHFSFYLSKINENADKYQQEITDKLKRRFQQVCSDLAIEESRFLQEVVYYLEKLDITEETNRISIHLESLEGLLKNGGEIGRKMDFTLQELGRETNTIGSKSAFIDISTAVVEMKTQLEKMREQALNIE